MVDLVLGPAAAPGTEVSLEAGGALMRRSVLPGGIRLLTESVPGQRSAAIGAWVAVGSRDETGGHHGSTHFLEHLLFKGTPTRTALDIAAAFDGVGGEANAATAKEYTAYYARVLDADLPMASETILDMVTSSIIDADEFESERGVILEELAMAGDDPVDVAHEAFAAAVFGEHALARPIGGTPATINATGRDAVLEHYRANYRSDELVVCAAGNVDHDRLAGAVLRGVAAGGWELPADLAPVARRSPSLAGPLLGATSGLAGASSSRAIARPFEQANILLGGLGPSATDERRFTLAVLNAVLGGSMSSRLFQEIREKRGLAYSVYSFAAGYADTGLFGVYAGCAPDRAEQVVELIETELQRLAREPVGADELALGIGQVRGNLVLGLEDSGARMARLGRAEITLGELTTVDENLARIAAVTAEQVRELAADLAGQPRHLVAVGPRDDALPLP
ncbi:insulinase family protein [Pseudactinotalea sp. HY160]|uniref:M16 family metallopeptidase n=1 Tax=Pseudactinotalea sp. HY160 TaxID=2654490 RepID=UPI00128E179E|nr:pitrilysin family protein [Pseudactinotalea sp. HY160]MPV49575.1 insulinase family protein [Pseudactinotalea sp. HY160]